MRGRTNGLLQRRGGADSTASCAGASAVHTLPVPFQRNERSEIVLKATRDSDRVVCRTASRIAERGAVALGGAVARDHLMRNDRYGILDSAHQCEAVAEGIPNDRTGPCV